MKRLAIGVVVGVTVTFGVVAQPVPVLAGTTAPPALQQALDKLVSDGVPGAIAIERRGEEEWRAASGLADIATGRPMRTFDRYRIGSITKGFVSAVALQRVAAGRLRLDDSVEHWLPGLVPDGSAITVRELMNHTSGIPDYADASFYLNLLKNPLQSYTPEQLVRLAVAKPPLFPPGTSWAYSNTNYILLGLIIAAVDHASPSRQAADPAQAVYRGIIGPLELSHTTFPLQDPRLPSPHAEGYEVNVPPGFGLPSTFDSTILNPSWAWTAGAIISTLDDVADFHRALFAGHLLPAAQRAELETTVPAPGFAYGLGVYRLQTPCGDAWGHDGGTPGFVNISLTTLDGTRQAVLMVNEDANTWTGQIGTDFGQAVLTAFCGQAPQDESASLAARALARLVRSGV